MGTPQWAKTDEEKAFMLTYLPAYQAAIKDHTRGVKNVELWDLLEMIIAEYTKKFGINWKEVFLEKRKLGHGGTEESRNKAIQEVSFLFLNDTPQLTFDRCFDLI
jgi:hypothetical protein